MPQKVCARLERIQRQFLWGGTDNVKKISLVKWATVCTDKRKGGIRIKSYSNMNKALLNKWSWRFANDRKSLWRRVISCKFGESSGGWHTGDLRGGYGTSLWKEIRKECLSFSQSSVFALGGGRRINFWKDVWCSGKALCARFPSLFNLALNKEARVAYIWESGVGVGGWSPTFLRSLNDWGIGEMVRFLQILHDQNFRPEGEDMLLLKEVKEKRFSVQAMYKCYDSSPAFNFPYHLIWNSVVPPKIGIFTWEAVWGKVLTLDNLKRRGMAFANRFFLCEEGEETINHLLIHCRSAKMLWDLFLSIGGISWVFPSSVIYTLLAWQGVAVRKKWKKIWTAAPMCLFWTLWCARNRLAFENKVTSAQTLKINFVSNLWSLANLFGDDTTNSILDFLTWLGCR